jgi:hypothetical protein
MLAFWILCISIIIWNEVDKMIRPIRQCCGAQCTDSKLCEQRALKEYRERQGTTWIDIIKHPLFIFGIAYIIGYLVGRG